MFSMALINILDAEVIHDENEHNGAPAMAPEARCNCALVVPVFMEACSKEVIGKFARLLEAIHTFGDLEVHPAIVCQCGEVVFVNEFIWDDGQLYFDKFWAVKGCAKVEVGDVKTGKGGSLGRQSAVD